MKRTIHDHRNHRTYANCPRGFVVTGSNRERDHDQWNREFIENNETGMWVVAPDRVFEGDAMFVLLPNPERRDGYPRQLFGGVVTGWRYEGDRTIFQVREFIQLSPIEACERRSESAIRRRRIRAMLNETYLLFARESLVEA